MCVSSICCHPAQPLGFALEGHPDAAYNGAYRKVSEHKGWPVLRNGAGMFCYRYEPTDSWFLDDEHAPDSNACYSNIKSAEGPLLIGAQTWQCFVGGEWVERELITAVSEEFRAVAQQLQEARGRPAPPRAVRAESGRSMASRHESRLLSLHVRASSNFSVRLMFNSALVQVVS